jgi:hypothetical protein
VWKARNKTNDEWVERALNDVRACLTSNNKAGKAALKQLLAKLNA